MLRDRGSVIEADASRFQRVEGSEVDWTSGQRASRPVREYLATQGRFKHLDEAGIELVQQQVNADWERLMRRIEHGT